MTETLTIGVINLWRPQNTTNFVTPTPPAEKMNNIVLNIELVYGLQRLFDTDTLHSAKIFRYLTHRETELSIYFLVLGTMVSQIL